MDEVNRREKLTVVVRKACFDLPTACPACLPVYCYLKFAKIPFNVEYNLAYPDSDQIPYIESGTYVAYNNEKGGVIESLKEDGIVDLDSEVHSKPEWISMKAMINSCLTDAIMYELWLVPDGSPAHKIYYSALAWPIGKILHSMQKRTGQQRLGITKDNVERIEGEIYKNATNAYNALSTWLGEESFFFENRPTSLDAMFLGHALFTLHALPETSALRAKLLDHGNLVRYVTKHKREFIDAGFSSSVPPYQLDPSSSTPRQNASNWSSKPKSKPKKEKTEQEKTFRRRAKYFLVTQLVAVLVFLSLLGGSDDAEVEVDDDSNFDD